MYIAMADIPAIVALNVKARCYFSTEPDSERITGNTLSRCCTTTKGYLCFTAWLHVRAIIVAYRIQSDKHIERGYKQLAPECVAGVLN